MVLLSLVFNVRFFSDYEEKLESGGDGLQSLPVCADNAFASAVEAGGVAELAAAVAGGANFDSISLSACGVVVGRRGSIRG